MTKIQRRNRPEHTKKELKLKVFEKHTKKNEMIRFSRTRKWKCVKAAAFQTTETEINKLWLQKERTKEGQKW